MPPDKTGSRLMTIPLPPTKDSQVDDEAKVHGGKTWCTPGSLSKCSQAGLVLKDEDRVIYLEDEQAGPLQEAVSRQSPVFS